MDRLIPSREARRAAGHWAALTDFDEYYTDEIGITRSRWLAEKLLPELNITSVLEVGTNSGRNLAYFRKAHPTMKLRGFDVNAAAIEYAKAKNPNIEFAAGNANSWPEAPKSWDAILTMSLLDHIPDHAAKTVLDNMVRTARRFVITVELWDGANVTRGLFKYSRNMKDEFEKRGVLTRRWELAVGQYDMKNSELWLYVGELVGDGRPE
jgi:SAM-dependent methyltransferase